MRISELIKTLTKIKRTYGDIAVTGGHMTDDRPLSRVTVTDKDGIAIWPQSDRSDGKQTGMPIDGIFLE